ncbi:MAG TPA: hypothetical protein GXX35_02550 [Thermoanaerobacterales bacterium]|nr:hypothetical protein [Thermoanaerobacterales bacterium]
MVTAKDINARISEQVVAYKEAYRNGRKTEMARCVRRISRLLSEKRRSKES